MWLELASTIGTPARRCGRAAAAAKCFLVSYWPLGPSGGGIVCGRVPCPEGRYIATSYALSDGDDDGGGVSRARSAARAFSRREASSSASRSRTSSVSPARLHASTLRATAGKGGGSAGAQGGERDAAVTGRQRWAQPRTGSPGSPPLRPPPRPHTQKHACAPERAHIFPRWRAHERSRKSTLARAGRFVGW